MRLKGVYYSDETKCYMFKTMIDNDPSTHKSERDVSQSDIDDFERSLIRQLGMINNIRNRKSGTNSWTHDGFIIRD